MTRGIALIDADLGLVLSAKGRDHERCLWELNYEARQTSAILPPQIKVGSVVTRRLVREALLLISRLPCSISTSRITTCAFLVKRSRYGTSNY